MLNPKDGDCNSDSKVSMLTSTGYAKDITLFAKWTAQEYDIIYKDADGTEFSGTGGETRPFVHTYGQTTKLPDQTKTNATFLGWYSDASCTTKITELGAFDYTASITVYAKWANYVEVKGSVIIHYEYTQNNKVCIVESKERAKSADIYLERRLENSNGDYERVGVDAQTVNFDTNVELQNNICVDTRTYTFGLLESVDENGQKYEYRVNTLVSNYKVEHTEEYNLELKFEPNNFDVKFQVDTSAIEEAGRPDVVNVKVLYWNPDDRTVSGYDPANTVDAYSYKGKITSIWPVISQLGGGYIPIEINGDTGIGEGSVSVWKHTNDQTPYPSYYQINVVSYEADGKTYVAGEDGTPFKVSYGTYGTYNNGSPVAMSAEIDRTYQVNFDFQGKGVDADGQAAFIKPETVDNGAGFAKPDVTGMKEEGYTFTGWYEDQACTKEWIFDAEGIINVSVVTKDITLYAGWKLDKYPIIKKLSNLTTEDVRTEIAHGTEYKITLKADEKYILPENVTVLIDKEETSSGYSYDSETGVLDIYDTSVIGEIEIRADGVLYAQEPVIITNPDGKEYYVDEETEPLTVEAVGQKGGKLTWQWYCSLDGSTEKGILIEDAVEDSYTPSSAEAGTSYYYCVVTNTVTDTKDETKKEEAIEISKAAKIRVHKWIQVTFDLNGMENVVSAPQVQKLKNDAAVKQPEAPYTEGYIFSGWYKDKECSDAKVWIFDGENVDIVKQDTVLYAKWTAQSYPISYKDQGNKDFTGTFETEEPVIHTYGKTTILQNPVKDGYTFAGWYKDADCTAENRVTDLGATQYTKDIILYAKWLKNLTINGTVTIHYDYQNELGETYLIDEGERILKTSVVLERRIKGNESDYIPVTEQTKEVVFDTTVEQDEETKHCDSSNTYVFTNIEPVDENGTEYEYRVNTLATNYAVNRKNTWDLELMFDVKSFSVPFTVDAGDITNQENRPEAVNVKVTYWNGDRSQVGDEPTGKYNGISEEWPIISQLEDRYIQVKLNEAGKGTGACSVWKNNNEGYTSYYQIAIVSYVKDGETIAADQAGNGTPFYVKGYGAYGTYHNGNPISMSVSLDRSFQLTYDLQNHGLAPIAADTVNNGDKVAAPDAPEDKAYEFGGWYQDASCENAWDFENNRITKDITLYAKWTLKEYNITNTLEHVKAAATQEKIKHGTPYELKLEAETNYILPANVTVTVDGITLSDGDGYNYNQQTGELKIDGNKVTGDIVINVKGILYSGKPVITTEPESQQYYVGEEAKELVVEAVGPVEAELTYQWYISTDGNTSDGKAILDATKTTYTPDTDTAGIFYYYCV
ncbi:MAG: InlB B-repeat-containing protein, partial [Lachnospiraceae bacterium]|nr:InlB B-repeat-containing protein [Lachnospiraceae bacterium]